MKLITKVVSYTSLII